MDSSLQQALLSPAVLAIVGLCIGSFLNVVVHRLPKIMSREWWQDAVDYTLGDARAWQALFGPKATPPAAFAASRKAIADQLDALPALSLSRPRSRCPHCGHQIRAHENIPVLGWLMLRGKCAGCGAAISARYPLVEIATGLLFAACAWRFGPQLTTLVWCAAIALLIAMALIDLDTTLLPDSLTLPLMGLGLLAALAGWSGVDVRSSAIGALLGYFSLWFITFAYRLLRGVQGMAEGDFKMLAGICALLGWKVLPAVLLLASLVGAAVGLWMIAFKGHKREVPIPFGPYLASGGIAAIFFGDWLIAFWNL